MPGDMLTGMKVLPTRTLAGYASACPSTGTGPAAEFHFVSDVGKKKYKSFCGAGTVCEGAWAQAIERAELPAWSLQPSSVQVALHGIPPCLLPAVFEAEAGARGRVKKGLRYMVSRHCRLTASVLVAGQPLARLRSPGPCLLPQLKTTGSHPRIAPAWHADD